jgi:hypothetical protein
MSRSDGQHFPFLEGNLGTRHRKRTECQLFLALEMSRTLLLRSNTAPCHKILVSPGGRGKVSREGYSTALSLQAVQRSSTMGGFKTYRRNLRWSLGTFLWFARPEVLLVEDPIFVQENKGGELALDGWAADSFE